MFIPPILFVIILNLENQRELQFYPLIPIYILIYHTLHQLNFKGSIEVFGNFIHRKMAGGREQYPPLDPSRIDELT